MKINVSGILGRVNSSVDFDGNININSINYMGENILVNSPVEVKAKIVNTGNNLLITGNINAGLVLKCSRCLESFNYNLTSDFEEELSNKEFDEDIIHFEGDMIDITDIVVNNILLYLPMKAVCNKNCKGLCPKCGKNLNSGECDCKDEIPDPRLAVLSKLLQDD